MTRSRRAGLSRDEVRRQPLYARMLGLQYLAPSGFLCFVFLEGAIALGILLALAELVSWWGVLVLPLTVAVMVKLNDVVAGALTRPQTRAPRRRTGPDGTAMPGAPRAGGPAGGPLPAVLAGPVGGPPVGLAGPAGGPLPAGPGEQVSGPLPAGLGGQAGGPLPAGLGGQAGGPLPAGPGGGGEPGFPARSEPIFAGRGEPGVSGPRAIDSPGADTVRLPPTVIAKAVDAPPLRPAAVPQFRPAFETPAPSEYRTGAGFAGGHGTGADFTGGNRTGADRTGADRTGAGFLDGDRSGEAFPGGETRRLPGRGGDLWPVRDDVHRPGFPVDAAAADGTAVIPGAALGDPGLVNAPRPVQQWTDTLDEQQRARQSAARRYE